MCGNKYLQTLVFPTLVIVLDVKLSSMLNSKRGQGNKPK
jgi:hypothetical protein